MNFPREGGPGTARGRKNPDQIPVRTPAVGHGSGSTHGSTHGSTLATLHGTVGRHAADLGMTLPEGDKRHSTERFQFMIFAVTRYALEATDVSARLRVPAGTLDGWALGSGIPAERAERARVMLVVGVMLHDELQRMEEMLGIPPSGPRLTVQGLHR